MLSKQNYWCSSYFIYLLLIGMSLKIYLNIHRNKKSNVVFITLIVAENSIQKCFWLPNI